MPSRGVHVAKTLWRFGQILVTIMNNSCDHHSMCQSRKDKTMPHQYNGHGKSIYTKEDKHSKVAELLEKSNDAIQCANRYQQIGYVGHAAAARKHADVLAKAAIKVSNGEGVSDHEQSGYAG
jgi:hypothetical protein